MGEYPEVRRVIVNLCVACIKGEGQECHTPGCALFLHRVDLPIHEELLEDADQAEARARRLVSYARHLGGCPAKPIWTGDASGPGDCTCGLNDLLNPPTPSLGGGGATAKSVCTTGAGSESTGPSEDNPPSAEAANG